MGLIGQPANSGLAGNTIIQPAEIPTSLTVSGKLEASDLSTVKCYRCYKTSVEAICHHCGRFICRECQPVYGFKGLLVDNVFAYLKPLPAKRFKHGAHCRDCWHQDLQIAPILTLVSFVFAVLILLLAWSNLDWLSRGLLIIFVSLLVGLIHWLAQLIPPLKITYPHGLPLFSQSQIELQEQVTANFNVKNIKDDPYLTLNSDGRGTMLVTLSVGPRDQQRYEQAPSPPLTDRQQMPLHAGFVALETLKNVKFATDPASRRRDNLLLLTRDVKPEAFGQRCRQRQSLQLAETYRIPTKSLQVGPPHDKEFPILIRPYLLDGGCRLEVILTVASNLEVKQVGRDENGKGVGKRMVGKPVLNSLMLVIPPICKVERTDGHFDPQTRQVIWRKKPLTVDPPRSVFVEFTEPIRGKDTGVEFTGEYNITIDDWTISQLHVAPDKTKYMIRPTNGMRVLTSNVDNEKLQWMAPEVKHKTTITGKVSINTVYLATQSAQIVSDLLEEETGQTKATGDEELLVAPTHHVVNSIVEAFSKPEVEVFIRQVIETVGHVLETEAGGAQARYWEIRGKYYRESGLQPFDLHLVISGEEPRNDQPNSVGTLTFELSLRSQAEVGDQDTYAHLVEKHTLFKEIIRQAAYRGRQVDYKGRRVVGWQKEEEFAKDFKQRYGVSEAAIILTNNPQVHGYIFYVPGDQQRNLPHLPCWRIKEQQLLPRVSTVVGEWIDKWRLLNEMEKKR